MFFWIICSEFLRTFTEETFLFEIFFHFSPIKTFPFGLILMGHISVFQVNDPKSMNFFYNFNIFRISCGQTVKLVLPTFNQMTRRKITGETELKVAIDNKTICHSIFKPRLEKLHVISAKLRSRIIIRPNVQMSGNWTEIN